MNSGSRQDGGGGRRCSLRAPTVRRWRSKNNGPMGKGGGGTDEMQGVGGGRKVKGEKGRNVDGEPHAWRRWKEVARGEGRQAIAIAVFTTATARAAARTRS